MLNAVSGSLAHVTSRDLDGSYSQQQKHNRLNIKMP
jgi:hypothetical protein